MADKDDPNTQTGEIDDVPLTLGEGLAQAENPDQPCVEPLPPPSPPSEWPQIEDDSGHEPIEPDPPPERDTEYPFEPATRRRASLAADRCRTCSVAAWVSASRTSRHIWSLQKLLHSPEGLLQWPTRIILIAKLKSTMSRLVEGEKLNPKARLIRFRSPSRTWGHPLSGLPRSRAGASVATGAGSGAAVGPTGAQTSRPRGANRSQRRCRPHGTIRSHDPKSNERRPPASRRCGPGHVCHWMAFLAGWYVAGCHRSGWGNTRRTGTLPGLCTGQASWRFWWLPWTHSHRGDDVYRDVRRPPVSLPGLVAAGVMVTSYATGRWLVALTRTRRCPSQD